MALPRFTSGSLGRLTFADINEICAAAELVQKFARDRLSPESSVEPVRREIWVWIDLPEPSDIVGSMPFYEVELVGDQGSVPMWQKKTNGIAGGSSANQGINNPKYPPCYSILKKTPPHIALPAGIARIAWLRAEDGSSRWLVVDREPNGIFPARITSAQVISNTNPTRWSYGWKEVQTQNFSNFVDFVGQRTASGDGMGGVGVPMGAALNGAEYASVPSGGSVYSVTRIAIKIGEVVALSVDSANKPFFHARNDYLVACI